MNNILAFVAVVISGAFLALRKRQQAPALTSLAPETPVQPTPQDSTPTIFEPGFSIPTIFEPEPLVYESFNMESKPQTPIESAPVKFGTPYDALIVSSAKNAGIEPAVLYRLLNQESRFRPDIISGATRSPVGAMGIAQFMPATAREWLGSEAAALDPQKAIPGAAKYLAWLERKTGDIVSAVAAYNWGIGNVLKEGLAKAPLETRQYVQAVLPGQSIG